MGCEAAKIKIMKSKNGRMEKIMGTKNGVLGREWKRSNSYF
jgi:hypothetical protein